MDIKEESFESYKGYIDKRADEAEGSTPYLIMMKLQTKDAGSDSAIENPAPQSTTQRYATSGA
jgi:hypothetical protein